MDSVGSWGSGYFPQLEKMPPHNHDGSGGNYLPHVYMPWWKFDRKNEFLRGYHIEPGGGRFMPVMQQFDDVCDHVEGYGASLKQSCRRSYGATIGMEAVSYTHLDVYKRQVIEAVRGWAIGSDIG